MKKFRAFLSSKFGEGSDDYKRYIEDPEELDEKYWEEYGGKPYPSVGEVDRSTKWHELLLPEVMFLIFSILYLFVFFYLLETLWS